ncbi:hypothetical protein GGI25_001479 [Coemansia spiralis]|uniref:DUF2428 domain-containing protein n=2 Tax=Coemansia TaxID=4863 RepID=A0A9W8GAQ5_9FUNG|nr:hypothetical protein EDC05_001442 [Coemansia umbellata]KAJ2624479.1 hypothetical protein GGI26_001397 [Coemansia sp. RSA 1358]KAJ2679556.1 hypothetical protein GGI25_001479 [Coemansia spiralis]
MGILQKDRRGTKGTKPPIPVPDCWIERIKADIDECAASVYIDDDSACVPASSAAKAEADIMHKLRSQTAKLAADVDTTWLEQSKRLKTIDGHILSLQRLPEVSSATLSYLRTVAIPIFVECYFLPSDAVVRRQAIPLIKMLSQLDPSCVDNVLQDNLLTFIGAHDLYDELDVFETADIVIATTVYSRQSVSQRAQALEVLASVPQGFPVIRRFVSEVMAYAANALDSTLPLLHNPRQGLGSVELVAHRSDCAQIIRLVFLCLSKLMSEESAGSTGAEDIQEAILASMRIPSPGFVEKSLSRVYQNCWDLISCENAALNSRQVAAMVLVSLIESSGLSFRMRAISLATRALNIQINDSELEYDIHNDEVHAAYLPVVDDSESRRQCMDDAVSMVCVARAIVSLASYRTALATLDIVPSLMSPSSCNNVHEAVFTHIASVCGRSQLAPGVKVIVFESMAIWLQETAKLLQRCLDNIGKPQEKQNASVKDLNRTAFALGQRVLVLQRERIMGYLWTYWDDPVDAVQVKIKAIFEAFLDIGSTMNKAIIADPAAAANNIGGIDTREAQKLEAAGDDSNAFIGDVLDLVLTMDWSRKVKYSLLATLSSRIDLFDLFKHQPDILSNCFEALSQVSMAPRVASLLTALLDRAASDIQKDSDGDTLALEKKYVDLWASPVVDALCKDDDTSRRMLVQHLLPNLFEALPSIVHTILRQLSVYQLSETLIKATHKHGRVASAKMQQRLDACLQHALIVVLKTARAQDLVTMDQLATIDADLRLSYSKHSARGRAATSLVEMLNHAVYHPDWSVRADMLGLLCEARKLSTPLSEIEFDLLFKLLRVSSNAPSADFRQQQHGSLTVLATRLVTVATHADRIVKTGRPPVPSQKVRHREKAKREADIARGKAEGKSEEQVLKELGVLSQKDMVTQAKTTLANIERAINRWLDLAVRGCLYPGAGFAKVAMGLRWLDILCSFFTPGRPAQAPDSSAIPFVVSGLSSPDFSGSSSDTSHCEKGAQDPALTKCTVNAEEIVTVLTQVLIDDPFDVNRASAFALLTSWPLVPTGDPRAAAAAQRWAEDLLKRALYLVNSTRAGESESGALIIRWLFRKFIVLQGMHLSFATAGVQTDSLEPNQSHELSFVNALLAMLRDRQRVAKHNLLDAAQQHPMHGLLTALQYIASEIDYSSSSVQAHAQQWQQWLLDLSQTAIDVCNIVLSVLTSASPEGNIPSSYREMEDKIDAIIQSATEAATSSSADELAGKIPLPSDDDDLLGGETGLGGPAGPKQQVILSYCWRAIKEVSSLLAAVATYPPGSDQAVLANSKEKIAPLIEESTIGSIGGLLRTLLTLIRHRGAFSAVHPAFTDVCQRMFTSPSAELNSQVNKWLEQCLDIATICKVSVTRRSAGWPLCLLSILTCDKHATQSLMPRAMDRIFALASDLETEHKNPKDGNSDDASQPVSGNSDGTTDLPQVHAINMLRTLLDDHALAADIVPYIEHAYVLSLTGLRSRRWAIRNVSGLLYAALTRRVFGNNQGRNDTKYDGITGRELFTRFPGLHPFLTNQLEDAVDRLAEVEIHEDNHREAAHIVEQIRGHGSEASKGEAGTMDVPPAGDVISTVMRSGARFIHPALYPCLILLARLQPSPLEASRVAPEEDSSEQQQAEAQDSTASTDDNSLCVCPKPGGRRLSTIAETAGVIATSPHTESAMSAVAPPMNLDDEPMTKVNERNSTVHVTSASTMLSMYSFTELVELCVESPVYKTREMAARAFAPLIPTKNAGAVTVSLLKGIRDMADTIATNNCHGTLCQIHELLRAHWGVGNGGSESMHREFIGHVFPALTSLWPLIVRPNNKDDEETIKLYDYDISDIIRHRYLVIINEYVARGESWLLQGIADHELVKTIRLLLSRFRISMLYGFLHPLFANNSGLLGAECAQVPGAYGTVLELTKLFLACVDDRTMAIVESDGTVQLEIEGELVDEHGAPMMPGGDEVVYDPWRVLSSILANNAFYEAKLAVLEWMAEHARNERMDIFQRIGVTNLLDYLVMDTKDPDSYHSNDAELQPSRDPIVRAASIRLLALLCTKLDIDVDVLPVHDLIAYWDSIDNQLNASFCSMSVAIAFVEFQAALIHIVHQGTSRNNEEAVAAVYKRAFAWTCYLYEWTDPERAAPYRKAVSRALVTYSAIKRYHEAVAKPHNALMVNGNSEEILRLCYWRLLQDDDEDIRSYMAQSISRRLGRELACDQACEQLIADFRPSSSGEFPSTYVNNRLDYILSVNNSSDDSVAEAVLAVINPNKVLFDHENPNIYIDEPRNVQLAYYSLVTIADTFFDTSAEARKLFARRSMQCVDALETALQVLVKSRKAALEHGVVLSGVLGVTSVSALFSLLQSWILGARLALFVGSRSKDAVAAKDMVKRIASVAGLWLGSKDLQPVHPWIARSLRQLLDMSTSAFAEDKQQGDVAVVPKEKILEDLFLLTNI